MKLVLHEVRLAFTLSEEHSADTVGSVRRRYIMSTVNSNKHLTFAERQIIETGIHNRSTQTAIAETLGKSKSTISREIKTRRVEKRTYALPVECARYKECRPGNKCKGAKCPDLVPFTCNGRDRSPGACNGCEKYSSCRYIKYLYDAKEAQKQYEETLIDARAGANLTTEEAKQIADTVRPLLQQGQSPYQILQAHPELGISEKTLYNYIENGVLEHFGLIALDLRRQVSRKLPKKKNELKKRKDLKYTLGRKYEDYLEYMELNPSAPVVQMDTVYNDVSNGPFIQTFKFLRYGFLFALLHEKNNGQSMLDGVNTLYKILGPEIFRREVNVLLTDRGSEFTMADELERSPEGDLRTRVFYCDPMRAGQKGSVENIHVELRYILPKGVDLYELGLDSQEKLNLAVSHVDSGPKEALNGKSPMEMLRFMAPDLYEKFIEFGLLEIEKDAVVLKPHLLK